jgi:hypothetical protein
VIRKLLTAGTLIYIGIPDPGASEDEAMLALHPSIDPNTL